MTNQKCRLAILTEIIAPYRIPVFNALAQHPDIHLHVIFLAETDPRLRQWLVYKDEIRFSYEVLRSWRLQGLGHKVLVNAGVRKALRKFSPTVVICGGYNYFASWEALSWARRNKVEFILWSESNIQDARSKSALTESLKHYFLSRCDGFVAPGKSATEYLRRLGCGPTIHTAPNAVDNEWFSARAADVRNDATSFRKKYDLPERFILYVGRLLREKGVFDLLEAYGRLEEQIRSQVGLVFVGDGAVRSELEAKARQMGEGTVRFSGFAHREELAGFYGLADLFIFPTHSDPWGLVVNEAMACGLPVIATSVAGCTADLVQHPWNGYVVAPGNAEDLRFSMERILRDAALRNAMSERSSEHIRNYSPQICAQGLATAALQERRPV